MKQSRILPVNIQLFAEGDPPPAEDKGAGGSPPPAEGETGKTFTQEDLNGIVARESKSAVEKLLKEAGIASEGDYKASMAAFKAWQDSQKTAIEKHESTIKTLQTDKEAAEAKAAELERKYAALSKGIPADKSQAYVKLAESYVSDKTDFGAALDMALKDFPLAAGGVGGAGGNPPPVGGDDESITDAIHRQLYSQK